MKLGFESGSRGAMAVEKSDGVAKRRTRVSADVSTHFLVLVNCIRYVKRAQYDLNCCARIVERL